MADLATGKAVDWVIDNVARGGRLRLAKKDIQSLVSLLPQKKKTSHRSHVKFLDFLL
ncbi:hypothetical protein [Botryobacter ruber]|uniref:hypothetical protein n=1 Tax=Botryobacter ruber TaxID=2171629 RepID=UPI0013E293FA|nr:hypothetical protein [Botryobacter ruber]